MQESTEKTDKGWQRIPHSYTLPAIKYLLPQDRRLKILDVGCGNGYITNQMAVLGHDIIAIDINSRLIAIARENYPSIPFEACSAYDDFKNLLKEADVVMATEVIEHLYEPRDFLQNAFNVLRPGGLLVLTTPYHGYLKNLSLSLFNRWDRHFDIEGRRGHIKFFSKNTLTRMLKDAGYTSITYRYAGRYAGLWCSIACRAEKPKGHL